MNDSIKIVVTEASDIGVRLDKCLAARLPDFSRSRIQQLIETECVKAEGRTITDSSRKVKQGDIYEITLLPPQASEVKANPLALEIVYEDADLLVINKAPGMTVHPAPGHTEDTLVNALLAHCGDSLSGIGGVMRPGIVHRIDKDTSGLLVVAKHDTAHRHLAAQLAERTLKRQYLAVVKGVPKPLSGTIEGNIARSPTNRKKMAVVKSGGKHALTHYRTEEILKDSTLVRCILETGRTHQIRVHMTHIGHPLIGDPVYGRAGKQFDFDRQALHAEQLTLVHPVSGKVMEFHAPLPQDMLDLLVCLRR
ncbi:MAG TPA: RluA family pseudouridine synthase [Rickettsiales bacterium]|nr:RluA family pseudouridine synthase [Rickettsiales bacterium]